MKRSNTYENKWEIIESPYKNRDMKNYGSRQAAEEGAHIMRLTTYLFLFALVAAISWITERDNHPFKDQIVEAKNDH